jgi:pimeloyl-ACP methyl ester carboxylesterase
MTGYERIERAVAGRTCAIHRWRPAVPSAVAPVLFLHGMGAHTGYHVNDLAEQVASAGIEVVAPDLPGFGGSAALDAGKYTPEAMAGWLVELCDVLGLEQVVAAGHSWGGYLVVYFAVRYPSLVSAMVLLDGGHADAPAVTYADALEMAAAVDTEYSFPTMEELFEAERPDFLRWSPALEQAYREAMVVIDGRYVMRQRPEIAAAIRVGSGQHPVTTLHLDLADTGKPLLAFIPGTGTGSPGGQAAVRLAEVVPTTELVWMEDCSHFLLQDAGPDIGQLMAAWLVAQSEVRAA